MKSAPMKNHGVSTGGSASSSSSSSSFVMSSSLDSSSGGNGNNSSVNAVMLLDRFVSASTATDVIDSLEGLERCLKQASISNNNNNNTTDSFSVLCDSLLKNSNPDNIVWINFWKLLHREHAIVQDDETAQEALLWTCRILLLLVSSSKDRAKIILQEPSPGSFLEALLDLICLADPHSNPTAAFTPLTKDTSPYVRVLACQVLHHLCKLQPPMAQAQLLKAPNGLHRLADQLAVDADEQVRNECLLLAATLATWPAVAQVWIFSNLTDRLLELAILAPDGGLTGGSVLVQDCLAILLNLVQHANPKMAAELLLASQLFDHRMILLLDLRQGQLYKFPQNTIVNNPIKNNVEKTTNITRDDNDDLDDLIKSATKPKNNAAETIEQTRPVPRLLASEEVILRSILDIWLALLQHNTRQVQEQVWRQHAMVLRMIWEMALLSPPPTPTSPYPCAIPSPSLQQYALHVMAHIFDKVNEIDRDRLLYLACTGGLGNTRTEKFQISLAALHVLDKASDTIFTSEMIAFALAPPTLDEEEEDETTLAVPQNAMVVPKLLSTVNQNLILFDENNNASSSVPLEDIHVIGLVGSIGALTLFLRDDVSRTMFLKLVQTQQTFLIPGDISFIDQVLQRLQHETDRTFEVAASLLRFLATWCYQAPDVVYAVLSSPQATVLPNLYNKSSNLSVSLDLLAGLVLGTCLKELQDETLAAGWTKETIMQILTRRPMVLQPRKDDADDHNTQLLAWFHDPWEWKAYQRWKKSALLYVRQAMVQYLTTHSTSTSGGGGGGGAKSQGLNQQEEKHVDMVESTDHSAAVKSVSHATLTQLVAHQTEEVETLRRELSKSQAQIAEKDKELAAFRLRVESTPTELDELVQETVQQNSNLKRQIEETEKKDQELLVTLSELQDQLTAEKGKRDEARLEAETLRQDIESLTHAFSNLEQELQRQQEQAKNAAADEKSNELASVSTQVATLRAENARLREDAKAADSWMKMAVERLQSLEQEKVAMSQQMANLKSEEEVEELIQKQHGQAVEQLRAQWQSEHDEALQKLQTRLEEQSLETNRFQTETERLASELDAARSKHEEERDQLQTRIEDLQQEIATVRHNAKQELEEESYLLKSQFSASQESIHSKDELIDQLEATVRELQSRLDSADLGGYTVEDVRARDEEIAQLRESNDAAQEWMANAVEHHNKMSEQLSALLNENASLQVQVQELTGQLLPSQASVLLAEQLQAKVDEQSIQVEALEKELEEQRRKLEDEGVRKMNSLEMSTNEKLNEKEAEVDQLKLQIAELKSLQHQPVVADDTSSDQQSLRDELESKTKKIQELLQEQMVHREKFKEVNTRACELDMEVAELKAELEDMIEEKALLEGKLSERLQGDYVAGMDELQEEKDRLVAELAEVSQAREQLELRCSELEDRCRLLTEQADSRLADVPTQTAGERRTENQADAVIELESQNAHLREELAAQIQEASSCVAQWQESYYALEAQCNELRTRISELEESGKALIAEGSQVTDVDQRIHQLQQLMDEKERQAAAVALQWEESYEALKKDNAELMARIEGLEDHGAQHESHAEIIAFLNQKIEQLEEKVKEANLDALNFQEQYNASLEEKRALEGQLSTMSQEYNDAVRLEEQLQQKVTVLERKVGDLESLLNNSKTEASELGERIKVLETELQAKEADLVGEEREAVQVIQEWKDSYDEMVAEKAAVEEKFETLLSREQEMALAQRREFEFELAALESKIQVLEMEKSNHESQISSLTSKLQGKEQDLEGFQHRMDSILTALDEARYGQQEDRAQIGNLGSALRDSEANLAKALRQISELEAELRSTEEKFAVDSLEADEVIEQWRESHEVLEAAKEEIEKRLEEVEAELADARKSLNEFTGTADQRDSETIAIKETLESLSAEKEVFLEERKKLESTISALQSKIQELEKEKATHESQISSLTSKLEENDQEIAALSRLKDDAVERSIVLEEDLLGLRSRMDSIVNALEEVRHRNDVDRAKIVELQSAVRDSEVDKANLNKAIERIAELEAELRNIDEKFAADSIEADEVIEQWKDSYESLEAAKAEVEKRLEELEAELAEARASRNEYMAMADQLYSDLARTRELEKMQASETVVSEEKSGALDSAEKEIYQAERQQSESTISTLQSQIQTLEMGKTTSESRISSLELRVEEKDQQISLLLREKDDAVERNKLLEDDLAELRSQMNSAVNELKEEAMHRNEADRAKIVQLELALAAGEVNKANLDKALERIAGLETKLATTEERFAASRKDAAEVIEHWKENHEKLEAAKAVVDNRSDELEKELAAARTKLNEYVIMMNELRSDLFRTLHSNEAGANEKIQGEETVEDVISAENEVILGEEETLESSLSMLRSEVQALVMEKQTYKSSFAWESKLEEKDRELFALSSERDQAIERSKVLEVDFAGLKSQMDSVINSLEEERHRTEEDQARIIELESSLNDYAIDIGHLDTALERINDLEAELRNAEEQYAADRAKADEAIDQLKASKEALEATNTDLEKRLEGVEAELAEAKASLNQYVATAKQKSSIEELEAANAQLEKRLELVEAELMEAKASLNQYVAAAKQELREQNANDLQKLLDEANARVKDLKNSERKLQAKCQSFEDLSSKLAASIDSLRVEFSSKELEHHRLLAVLEEAAASERRKFEEQSARVLELEQELAYEIEHADEAIQQWQESYNVLAAEKEDLEAQVLSLGGNLKSDDWLVISLNSRIDELQRCLDERAESERLTLSNKGEVEEIGKLVEKDQLEPGIVEIDVSIATSQERCSELEKEKDSREEDLSNLNTAQAIKTVSYEKFEHEVALKEKAEEEILALKQKLQEACQDSQKLEQKLHETEAMLTARLEEVLSEQERSHVDRENQRKMEQERFSALERDYEDVRAELAVVEQERYRLQVTIAELEGELKEVSDELKFRLTNEISEQATKLAADALRRQVDELREQAEIDLVSLNAERSARFAAEFEAKRLQHDLAAVLGLEYTESNKNEIYRRTAEVTEQFQRAEKAEIDELRASLNRAVEELESARSSRTESDGRADTAELRLVQLEQELFAAKSDLKLVSQIMEEMRDAESSRRASMDYRILSLEDEQSIIRRLHEAELENMRNELEQVSMERDSLAQSLKESESNREALMVASSRGRESEAGQNTGVELVRLRMEKAHLLVAASQEASRTERRLRELREAAKSSVEADVLVERELRAAAELALENATKELRELRLRQTQASRTDMMPDFTKLEAELKKFKDQVSSLEHEKIDIQKLLDDSKQSSQEIIESLREEIRSAKAKALQSERAVRHDAEVRAELSRLHQSRLSGTQVPNSLTSYGEHKYSDDTHLSNLYDLVQQQRQTIEDQREAHSSLENDFEGLLALLAQSKLIEESLSSALLSARGEKAVTEAIMHAEEKALAQYGSFVRVSE